MTGGFVLDTGVLGQIVHPRKHQDVKQWFRGMVAAPRLARIAIAEIADYEVRRKLIHIGSTRGIEALDRLGDEFEYLALTTPVMRTAARLWADARRAGLPTADERLLDGDVILAAQAIDASATVITTNVAHLSRYVQALRWQDLQPESL